jgi:glycosyltransferase involved in cell wall biosynthesis
MIEAMACGTPVIAFRRGSVPEVMEHGVTGFIVDTVDEAVDAAHHIGSLDRNRVRRRFEQRFTVERMARDYVETYRRNEEFEGRTSPAPSVTDVASHVAA